MDAKYTVIDKTDIFEFHDAKFTLERVEGNDIFIIAEYVNIHKIADHNPKGYDLEIDKALISFLGVSNLTYEPGRAWTKDENGNDVPLGPEIIFDGIDAWDKVTDELRRGVYLYTHSIQTDENTFCIDGCGIEPYFMINFKATGVRVEWDGYRKPAWYELKKYSVGTVTLETPDGDRTLETHIWKDYDTDELFGVDDPADIDPKKIQIGITYNKKEIWGRGRDYTGMDAYADLQKHLPEEMKLKCCVSCRHGNMCPTGNASDELFCTKDVIIKKPEDLFDYTENKEERINRSRHYTDVCDDWKEQGDDYFTYSDYQEYIKGK